MERAKQISTPVGAAETALKAQKRRFSHSELSTSHRHDDTIRYESI